MVSINNNKYCNKNHFFTKKSLVLLCKKYLHTWLLFAMFQPTALKKVQFVIFGIKINSLLGLKNLKICSFTHTVEIKTWRYEYVTWGNHWVFDFWERSDLHYANYDKHSWEFNKLHLCTLICAIVIALTASSAPEGVMRDTGWKKKIIKNKTKVSYKQIILYG